MTTKKGADKTLLIGVIVILGIMVIGTAALILRVRSITQDQATQAAIEARIPAGNFHIGGTLPPLTFTNAEGESVTLASLLDGNHFVVINFTHPDCPCARTCGELIATMFEEEGDDFHVVGILAAGEDDPRVVKALEEHRREGIVTYPVFLDRDRSLRKLFGATRTPEVWVLDKDGTIAYYGAPESTLFPGAEDHRFLLREAIVALRNGQEPEFRTFMPIGCPMDS
jgi:peroxiredoxin